MIIIGARGHGRMVAAVAREDGIRVAGFLDQDASLHGMLIDEIPVLGGHDLLTDYRGQAIGLGIGTNEERKRLYEELRTAGFLILDFHAPSATVNVGATIGVNVILNTGCLVEHDCVVRNHAHLCPGAILCGGVTVGEGAVIGAGAVVKDGVTIGAWATVGCGAVVIDDVPDGVTVIGNPAQLIGRERFEQKGYCVLRALFHPGPVLAALHEVEVQHLTGRQINVTSGKVNSIHGLPGAFFDDLLHSEQMRQVASILLGERAVPRAVELFAKPARVGLPSPWHQDNAYWCAEPPVGLTIWLALDHSDDENGAVSYVPGSHLRGLQPHVPSGAPGSSQTLAPHDESLLAQSITPQLRPGDAVAHHCLTIHGSGPTRSARSRRGVTLQYVGQSVRYDEVKVKAYEAALVAQQEARR